MTITKVQLEALSELIKFCDEAYMSLEPYTSKHNQNFKPPLSAFGGVPGQTSFRAAEDGRVDYMEPVYRFEPLTEEEYERESGKDLDRGGYIRHTETWAAERMRYDRCKEDGGANVEYTDTSDNAPWAVPLKKTWDDAVDDRLEEVKVVRDELRFLLEKLAMVARRYPEVDAANKEILDKYREN